MKATLGLEGSGQAVIEDGPARGCRFWGVRLPEFLRVVHVPGQRVYPYDREFDCLDQLDDTTRRAEVVVVYRQRAWAHYRGSGYVAAYVHVADLDTEVVAGLDDNATWRAFVADVLAELPPLPRGEPPLPAFACTR